jgi:hypothetical protein
MTRPTIGLLSLYVLCFFWLAGCGGGSGSSAPPPVGPPPGFSIKLSPLAISIPAGSTASFTVQISPQTGFSGTVNVAVSGLPAGVTASPTSLNVTGGSSGTISLSSSANSLASQAQITFTGTSESQVKTTTATLTITGSQAGAPALFQMLGGEAERAIYDEKRQLLFVTNRNLNEVDVLSGATLAVQHRILVPQPYGIDQMADGNTIVVGTLTQAIYTIDEGTLAVTQHLCPQFPNNFFNTTNVTLNPVALANGKVLMTASYAAFIPDYVFGGLALIEWNSVTDTFTELMSAAQNGAGFGITNLKRSADHKWAILAANPVYLYSSDSDQFTSSTGPVIDAQPFNVRDVAANPDGTQFAVVSAQEVTFYDRKFLKRGKVTTILNDAFQNTNAQYSSDGNRLYWGMSTLPVVDVLDAVNFVELGNVTTSFGRALTQIGSGFPQSFLWVDSTQRVVIGASGGIGMVDASVPLLSPPTGGPLGIPNPYAMVLDAAAPISFSNFSVPSGTEIFVAGLQTQYQPGPPLIVIPPLISVTGPADLAVKTPEGRIYYSPQVLSFGTDIAVADATLLPPTGNPYLTISGFGLYNDPLTSGTITLGGRAGTNTTVNTNAGTLNALQQVRFQAPTGQPGPADIAVSSNQGTGKLAGAVSFIPSSTILPATGLIQLLYDTRRNVVYGLTSTLVKVLNPTTLQWQSPIVPGGTGGSGYVSMTLTPDGTNLLIADSVKDTLTVVSPENPSLKTDIAIPTFPAGNIVATATGKVFLGGTSFVVDLPSQTATIRMDDNPPEYAGTPDGTHIVGARFSESSGSVFVWNAAKDTFTSQGFAQGFWTDLAIANDGSTFAAIRGEPGLAGVIVAIFDQQLHYLNTIEYPDFAQPNATQVLGAQYTPSGRTLVIPAGDSLDFFDVFSGTLRGRLLTPEPLPVLVFPDITRGNLALSPDAKTIYVISQSGLTVLQLATSIDSLIPAWSQQTGAIHAAQHSTVAPAGQLLPRITRSKRTE